MTRKSAPHEPRADLTSDDVAHRSFTPVRLREGYDMAEVDEFLDDVVATLDRLVGDNDRLRAELADRDR